MSTVSVGIHTDAKFRPCGSSLAAHGPGVKDNVPLLHIEPLFSSLVRTPKNGMRLLLANLAGASLASPPAQWLLPQPPALPWEPDNFLFLSGIEGEDHPFLTANAENSPFLFLLF